MGLTWGSSTGSRRLLESPSFAEPPGGSLLRQRQKHRSIRQYEGGSPLPPARLFRPSRSEKPRPRIPAGSNPSLSSESGRDGPLGVSRRHGPPLPVLDPPVL